MVSYFLTFYFCRMRSNFTSMRLVVPYKDIDDPENRSRISQDYQTPKDSGDQAWDLKNPENKAEKGTHSDCGTLFGNKKAWGNLNAARGKF